jgi:CDP-4-dehydro-6-deoxyglucose reductase, E1
MPNIEDIRSDIHAGVDAYCRETYDFSFDPENPVVRLHEPTFAAQEINAAVDVLLSNRVTMGPKVKAFEREFAEAFTFNYGIMNNSGSSANLLAVAALTNVEIKDRLKPGDEVIVPALSWSTTVWPLIQYGLIPVIVDIDPDTMNIDPNEVEKAIGPKTRGVMPVHVYGNPCDMDALTNICEQYDLVLLEDCCEALGAYYDGIPVGKFGKIGTFSFYFSHHMTTLEGGICVTQDVELAEMMRILRAHGWIREVDNPTPYVERYPEFDPRFLFVNLGYNLRATELQGAMGSVQLPKLSGFVKARRLNTKEWQKKLSVWSDFLNFQLETPKAMSSCFGFPMLISRDAPFERAELTSYLNEANIETRPIICGNIALQPAMKLYEHRVVGDLQYSTNVMNNGFSVGNHQAVDARARGYVANMIEEFMGTKGERR